MTAAVSGVTGTAGAKGKVLVGESGSLGDLVRAELETTGLRDADLVGRLCARIDDAARAHGVDGALPADLSVTVGGALALAVLESIDRDLAQDPAAPADDPVGTDGAELDDLRGRLEARRADPDNIENLSFGQLVRRLVRGGRGGR